MGIKSVNLDDMVASVKSAGWESPTTKGNWHLTLTDMTGDKFSKKSSEYKKLTQWFGNMPESWAVVLVSCYKKDGDIRFHRQDGFSVRMWANGEISV